MNTDNNTDNYSSKTIDQQSDDKKIDRLISTEEKYSYNTSSKLYNTNNTNKNQNILESINNNQINSDNNSHCSTDHSTQTSSILLGGNNSETVSPLSTLSALVTSPHINNPATPYLHLQSPLQSSSTPRSITTSPTSSSSITSLPGVTREPSYNSALKQQHLELQRKVNNIDNRSKTKVIHSHNTNIASDNLICTDSHFSFSISNALIIIGILFTVFCMYSFSSDPAVIYMLPAVITATVNYFELNHRQRVRYLAGSFPLSFLLLLAKPGLTTLYLSFTFLSLSYCLSYYAIRAHESIQLHANLLNQAKNNFISSITHDLRTPLHAILGTCQVMNSSNKYNSNLSAEQLEHLQLIEDGGRSLLSLVNSMLDISKIENGKMQLHNSTIDLWALTDKCIELLLQLAENKNIEFYNIISNKVPQYVTADGFRLEQILMNLLGNGIKFTSQGSVILKVDVIQPENYNKTNGNHHKHNDKPIPSDHVRLLFSVIDTGVGVSEDQQSKLFGKFEQANSSINLTFGGSGLGLFICKQLCNLMGASIRLESKLGQGTKFFVEMDLPIAPNSPSHQRTVETHFDKRDLIHQRHKLLSFVPNPHLEVIQEYSKPLDLSVIPYHEQDTPINLKDFQLIITDLDHITQLQKLFEPILHSTAPADLSYNPHIFLLRGVSERSRDLIEGTKEFLNQFLSSIVLLPKPLKKSLFLNKFNEVLQKLDSNNNHPTAPKNASHLRLMNLANGTQRHDEFASDMQQDNDDNINNMLDSDDPHDPNFPSPLVLSAPFSGKKPLLKDGSFLSPQSCNSILSAESLSSSSDSSGSPLSRSAQLTRSLPSQKRTLRARNNSITNTSELSPTLVTSPPLSSVQPVQIASNSANIETRNLRQRVLKQSHFHNVNKNMLVLIVDDSLVNVKVAANMLRIIGVNSEKVQSGQAALDRLLDMNKPKITHVLTDIHMPEMDGMELARRIRDLNLQYTPFIIGFTASPSEEICVQCIKAGITSFISKPMELDQVAAVLGLKEQTSACQKFTSTSPLQFTKPSTIYTSTSGTSSTATTASNSPATPKTTISNSEL